MKTIVLENCEEYHQFRFMNNRHNQNCRDNWKIEKKIKVEE